MDDATVGPVDLAMSPDSTAAENESGAEHRAHSRAEVALGHMFRRDFLYVFGGVLPLALSALILPALTRIMGREQFGIASFAISISAVLFLIMSLGLQTGVQREYPKPDGVERTRALIAMAVVIIVCLSAALAFTAPLWAPIVGARHFSWAMVFVAWWCGGAAISLVCLGFLRSADRVGAFMAVIFTQSIGSQTLGVLLVVTLHHSAHDYLTGVLIGQLTAALLALILVRPRISGLLRFALLFEALAFTLPLVPQQLAAFVLWSGDRVIVQRDLGSAAQARYAVAYAVGAITINIVNQLNQAWMPRVFAMEDLAERRVLLQHVQERLARLLAIAVLALSLAVPFLLVVASPGSYHPRELTLVTLFIVPTALPFSVALANTRTLLAHGRSVPLAVTTVICAVTNLLLNIALVPHLGISGSAFATLVSYALLAWMSSLMVRNEADRLPGRAKAEVRQWLLVGTCLATALIPWTAPGMVGRALGLLAVLGVGVVLVAGMTGRGPARNRARMIRADPDYV